MEEPDALKSKIYSWAHETAYEYYNWYTRVLNGVSFLLMATSSISSVVAFTNDSPSISIIAAVTSSLSTLVSGGIQYYLGDDSHHEMSLKFNAVTDKKELARLISESKIPEHIWKKVKDRYDTSGLDFESQIEQSTPDVVEVIIHDVEDKETWGVSQSINIKSINNAMKYQLDRFKNLEATV
jgi:hypothetical protein